MFGLKIDQAKAGFFDTEAVIAAEDKAARKALSRFGAFVRTRSRSSIRRRKKVSQPGQPPSAHSKDPVATIKNILFSYEPERRSVVIGPVALNQVDYDGGIEPAAGTVPEVLEKGGVIVVREELVGRRWVRADQRRRRVRNRENPQRFRRVTIKARPFMGPAFAAEQQRLPDLWRDSIAA